MYIYIYISIGVHIHIYIYIYTHTHVRLYLDIAQHTTQIVSIQSLLWSPILTVAHVDFAGRCTSPGHLCLPALRLVQTLCKFEITGAMSTKCSSPTAASRSFLAASSRICGGLHPWKLPEATSHVCVAAGPFLQPEAVHQQGKQLQDLPGGLWDKIQVQRPKGVPQLSSLCRKPRPLCQCHAPKSMCESRVRAQLQGDAHGLRHRN